MGKRKCVAWGGMRASVPLPAVAMPENSAAIARLPLPFREVLVLREIEELAYEEIARVMEIPKGTVMSLLSCGSAVTIRESRGTTIFLGSILARLKSRP